MAVVVVGIVDVLKRKRRLLVFGIEVDNWSTLSTGRPLYSSGPQTNRVAVNWAANNNELTLILTQNFVA